MAKISTKLPDRIIESLDKAADTLGRPRSEIVRQAIERYLEDIDDLDAVIRRRQEPPAEPALEWEDVKRDLLGLAG